MENNKTPEKTDKRKTKTKKLIRSTLIELLAKKSINEITITELAETAQIDRKTFYLHYDTIGSIITEIESEIASKIESFFKETKEFSFELIFKKFEEIITFDPELFKLANNSIILNMMAPRFKDVLKELVRRFFSSKIPQSKEQFEVTLEFMASGLMGIYTSWLCTKNHMPIEKLSEYATSLFYTDWQHILDTINE